MAPYTDNTFSDLSPFYTPGAPPPTLPIPIAQTEVGKFHSPSKLLAEEEIGPKSKAHRNTGQRFDPYPKSTPKHKVTRFAHQRSQTPNATSTRASTPNRATTPRAASPSDEGSHSQSISESGSSHASSLEDEDEGDDLIPKPEGEAGRPGRGGYNLEEKLGWNRKEFQRVKKYVQGLIDEHLNPAKSYASQPIAALVVVRNKATERFPVLSKYAQSWPATDLIRQRLKYTSGRARNEVDKADAEAGKILRRSVRK